MISCKGNRGLTTLSTVLLVLVIIAAPTTIILLNASLMVQTADTEPSNLFVVHAQESGNTGCASCHTKPIAADCSACHASPPTEIDGVTFPHHNSDPGGPPDNCQSCHGEGDARYAETPNFNHDYCSTCHTMGPHARIGQP
jgi:hypothetical protein